MSVKPVGRTERSSSPQVSAAQHRRVQTWFLGTLALWATVVVSLSLLGVTARLPTQLLPIPVVIGIAVPLAFYAWSTAFRAYIQSVDLRALTLFNVWRVPAALAFFYYGSQGELPAVFVRNAGWGDLLAGLLAPLVVYGLGAVKRWRLPSYVGFHLFSFADFVVAVGTGFAFSLLGDPLMNTLRAFPMATIPLFGVPVTGALSLMALHRLAVKRK